MFGFRHYLKKHYEGRTFECCGLAFKKMSQFRIHKEVHVSGKLTCAVC